MANKVATLMLICLVVFIAAVQLPQVVAHDDADADAKAKATDKDNAHANDKDGYICCYQKCVKKCKGDPKGCAQCETLCDGDCLAEKVQKYIARVKGGADAKAAGGAPKAKGDAN